MRTTASSRIRGKLAALASIVLASTIAASGIAAGDWNGFDVSAATVPRAEILRGGPARDGIPALDMPARLAAGASPWPDDEWVVGVALGGRARAYPLSLLVWHELVNDVLAGRPILVSYCPLCGTAIVFARDRMKAPATSGRRFASAPRFGVSGLLYQSDLLMFDRATDSLWSQLSAQAVSGPLAGARLAILRARTERWGDWRTRHPETTILDPETGHDRPYGRGPYGDYARSRRLFFPAPEDPRYHPKMRTVGLRAPSGATRAYPDAEIERAGGHVRERFADASIEINRDPASGAFDVTAAPELEVVEAYWFAWAAFHPGSSVYPAPHDPADRPPKPETGTRAKP